MNGVRIGLLLALAVAAAVVANIVLLGVATGSGEPVGKLPFRPGPAATLRPPPPPRTTATPPSSGGDHRDSHEDD